MREALWGRFLCGAVELHLGVEADFRSARKAHPGIRVAGLDALAARLAAAGAPVVRDDSIPGRRRSHSEDPVGNRPEFLSDAEPPADTA